MELFYTPEGTQPRYAWSTAGQSRPRGDQRPGLEMTYWVVTLSSLATYNHLISASFLHDSWRFSISSPIASDHPLIPTDFSSSSLSPWLCKSSFLPCSWLLLSCYCTWGYLDLKCSSLVFHLANTYSSLKTQLQKFCEVFLSSSRKN